MKKTLPFTTTSGDYLSVLISLWLPRYGWTIVVPLLVCAVVGFLFDARFLFIALMLLFIVVPMLMSFLYTYYMLTPEARRSVLRKEVEISEGESLRLVYLPKEESELEKEKDKSRRMLLPIADKEDREEERREEPLPDPETIGWSEVLGVKYTSRFTVYLLKGEWLTFLLIPHSAMPRVVAE